MAYGQQRTRGISILLSLFFIPTVFCHHHHHHHRFGNRALVVPGNNWHTVLGFRNVTTSPPSLRWREQPGQALKVIDSNRSDDPKTTVAYQTLAIESQKISSPILRKDSKNYRDGAEREGMKSSTDVYFQVKEGLHHSNDYNPSTSSRQVGHLGLLNRKATAESDSFYSDKVLPVVSRSLLQIPFKSSTKTEISVEKQHKSPENGGTTYPKSLNAPVPFVSDSPPITNIHDMHDVNNRYLNKNTRLYTKKKKKKKVFNLAANGRRTPWTHTADSYGNRTRSKRETTRVVYKDDRQNLTVVEGQVGRSATIKCYTKYRGGVLVSWLRRDISYIITVGHNIFSRSGRYELEHDPEEGLWQLTIANIKDTDEGMYECQLATSDQPVSLFFNLTVKESKAIIRGPPEITVGEGHRLTLNCTVVDALAPPKYIIWLLDGSVVPHMYPKTTPYSKTLHVSKVGPEHDGLYSCDPYLAVPDTVRVNVVPAELISGKDILGSYMGSDGFDRGIFDDFDMEDETKEAMADWSDVFESSSSVSLLRQQTGFLLLLLLPVFVILGS